MRVGKPQVAEEDTFRGMAAVGMPGVRACEDEALPLLVLSFVRPDSQGFYDQVQAVWSVASSHVESLGGCVVSLDEVVTALAEMLTEVTEALEDASSKQTRLLALTELWLQAAEMKGVPESVRATFLSCAEDVIHIYASVSE
jgi:NAD-dependent oxidoreductase involved in siderophore biosynthesis